MSRWTVFIGEILSTTRHRQVLCESNAHRIQLCPFLLLFDDRAAESLNNQLSTSLQEDQFLCIPYCNSVILHPSDNKDFGAFFAISTVDCLLTRPYPPSKLSSGIRTTELNFRHGRRQIFDELEINCSSRPVPLHRTGHEIKCQGGELLHACEILSFHLEPRAWQSAYEI